MSHPDLCGLIEQHYAKQPARDWVSPFRASSAGKCQRALAYQLHHYDPLPLNSRAHLVFALGDMVEASLMGVLLAGGCTDPQKSLSTTIGGHVITGHVDCLWDGKPVDIKSTTTFGLRRAKQGHIEGYAEQVHVYMQALDVTEAYLLYYCKEQSTTCQVNVAWSDVIWGQVVNRFSSVGNSTPERLPAREYGPDDKGALPWQCSYCSFNQHCWPDQALTFDAKGKPVLTAKEIL